MPDTSESSERQKRRERKGHIITDNDEKLKEQSQPQEPKGKGEGTSLDSLVKETAESYDSINTTEKPYAPTKETTPEEEKKPATTFDKIYDIGDEVAADVQKAQQDKPDYEILLTNYFPEEGEIFFDTRDEQYKLRKDSQETIITDKERIKLLESESAVQSYFSLKRLEQEAKDLEQALGKSPLDEAGKKDIEEIVIPPPIIEDDAKSDASKQDIEAPAGKNIAKYITHNGKPYLQTVPVNVPEAKIPADKFNLISLPKYSSIFFDYSDNNFHVETESGVHVVADSQTKSLLLKYAKMECGECREKISVKTKKCPTCYAPIETIDDILKPSEQKDDDERVQNIRSAATSTTSRRIRLEHNDKIMGWVSAGKYLGQDIFAIEDSYVTRNEYGNWEDAITSELINNQGLLDIADLAEKTLSEELAKEREGSQLEAEESRQQEPARTPASKTYLYDRVEYKPGLLKKYHIIRSNDDAIRVSAISNPEGKYFVISDGDIYRFDLLSTAKNKIPVEQYEIAPNVLEQIVRDNRKYLKPLPLVVKMPQGCKKLEDGDELLRLTEPKKPVPYKELEKER